MNDSRQRTENESGPTVVEFLRAAHALEDRLERALGLAGLSMAKYGALSVLTDAGEPQTLSELAARLSCVRSNMTQLVDRLEADGLVRRLADPSDRRIVRVAMTKLGSERQAAGIIEIERVQREFTVMLSAADRAALGNVTAALS